MESRIEEAKRSLEEILKQYNSTHDAAERKRLWDGMVLITNRLADLAC